MGWGARGTKFFLQRIQIKNKILLGVGGGEGGGGKWEARVSEFLSPRITKLWRGYGVCPVRMYVRTYERTYVRSFVCSPFVIALATSFIIQYRYNFTQILSMTIPQTSLRFSVIGSRSKSQ